MTSTAERHERAVAIAAQMQERRRNLRALLGDSYATRIASSRSWIERMARGAGLTYLQAALELCEQAYAAGHGNSVNFLVAAALDLMEERA